MLPLGNIHCYEDDSADILGDITDAETETERLDLVIERNKVINLM